MLIYCIKLDHALYSINYGNAKFDSYAHNVFCLSWLSGWKPVYLLVPSKNAECNIMPLITPHACARGKVIGHIVVVVSTKIAIS